MHTDETAYLKNILRSAKKEKKRKVQRHARHHFPKWLQNIYDAKSCKIYYWVIFWKKIRSYDKWGSERYISISQICKKVWHRPIMRCSSPQKGLWFIDSFNSTVTYHLIALSRCWFLKGDGEGAEEGVPVDGGNFGQCGNFGQLSHLRFLIACC